MVWCCAHRAGSRGKSLSWMQPHILCRYEISLGPPGSDSFRGRSVKRAALGSPTLGSSLLLSPVSLPGGCVALFLTGCSGVALWFASCPKNDPSEEKLKCSTSTIKGIQLQHAKPMIWKPQVFMYDICLCGLTFRGPGRGCPRAFSPWCCGWSGRGSSPMGSRASGPKAALASICSLPWDVLCEPALRGVRAGTAVSPQQP